MDKVVYIIVVLVLRYAILTCLSQYHGQQTGELSKCVARKWKNYTLIQRADVLVQ